MTWKNESHNFQLIQAHLHGVFLIELALKEIAFDCSGCSTSLRVWQLHDGLLDIFKTHRRWVHGNTPCWQEYFHGQHLLGGEPSGVQCRSVRVFLKQGERAFPRREGSHKKNWIWTVWADQSLPRIDNILTRWYQASVCHPGRGPLLRDALSKHACRCVGFGSQFDLKMPPGGAFWLRIFGRRLVKNVARTFKLPGGGKAFFISSSDEYVEFLDQCLVHFVSFPLTCPNTKKTRISVKI